MVYFRSMNLKFVIVLTVACISFNGCKKDKDSDEVITIIEEPEVILNLPNDPYDYASFQLPSFIKSNLDLHDDTKEYGPVTNWGATLGRVIFYDKLVSKTGNVACASCHIQEFGFSDTARYSVGDAGGLTGRHSMGLANARYRIGPGFFWDERANSLEDQVLMPIQDQVEMNMTMDTLVNRIEQAPYYTELFTNAFGDPAVSTERIASALAQFVRSLTSFNSKFDEGLAMHDINQPFNNFTAEENLGKDMFMRIDKGKCASCHTSEAMISDFARNNGLSARSPDPGLEGATGDPMDFGKFRAPSLRNIAVRPPYMHDGGYTSLGDIVFAYNKGIAWSPTLDPHFLALGGGPGAIQLDLTPEESNALVTFLETLTDNDFLTDPKYSDPFIK